MRVIPFVRQLFLRLVLAAALGAVGAMQGAEIVRQPQQPALPIKLGSSFDLTVGVKSAKGVTFQWQRNGVNIPGAGNASLPFSRLVAVDGGTYSVLVSDLAGTVRSDRVLVYADVPELPFSDDFAQGRNALSGDSGVGRGDNLKATVQRPTEPLHAGESGGASVWLWWRPSVTGVGFLSTLGSSFDTVLAVYEVTNPKDPFGSLRALAANDDTGRFNTSELQFNVVAEKVYYIAVDGHSAKLSALVRGQITLRWRVDAATLLVPELRLAPVDVNGIEDGPVELKTDFESKGDAIAQTIQWFRNGAPILGVEGGNLAVPRLTRKEVGVHFAQVITVNAKGERRTNETPHVDLQIHRRSNAQDAHVYARDRVAQAVKDVLSPPPIGAARAGRPRPVSLSRGTSGTQIFNNVTATTEPGEPNLCGVGGGSSEWYAILAAESGVLEADTEGSEFDTVLAGFFDTGLGEGLFDGMVELACNNDSGGTSASRIAFPVEAGKIYLLAVDGMGGATGVAQLNYELVAPLTLVTGPTNQTAVTGGAVTFTALASGHGPLSYRWFNGNVPVEGGTTASLLLQPVTAGHAGNYSVTVTNELGEAVFSASATLTVVAPPEIAVQPASVTRNQGEDHTFSVMAMGTAPLAYQWFKGVAPIGSATGGSHSLSMIGAGDAGVFRVVITNIAGSVTSSPATLTVIVPPTTTVPPASATRNEGQSQTFTVTATGTEPFTYQWKKGDANLPTATGASYTINTVAAGDAGDYRVVVSNAAGNQTSAAATLTVIVPPTITTPPANATRHEGQSQTFTVTATGTEPFTYQWKKGDANLPTATGASYTINTVAAGDAGDYRVVVSNAAGNQTSAAATLTVIVPPTITAPPANATRNEGQSQTFTVTATGTEPFSYQWKKGDANLPTGTGASYTISTVAAGDAGDYRVVVSNAAGNQTSAAATLTVIVPPTITAPPASATRNWGDNQSFSVAVSGTAPFTYQWQRGTTNLPGATAANLVLNGVTSADAGAYAVTVSNSAGSVTSGLAQLTVNPPAAPVLSYELLPDGRFRVHLTGQPGVTYEIQAATNALDWQPVHSGSSPSGQLEYTTPAAVPQGTRQFRGRGP